MRLWFSGPRIMGIRTGISIPLNQQRRPAQKSVGKAIDNSGFLYVVRGDHNLTKIGVTTNPRARLAQLKTASAFPVDFAFLGVTPGPGYDIEKEAHRLLDNRRVNGEWFDVSPEVAIGAVMSAAGKLGQPVTVCTLETVDKAFAMVGSEEAQGSGFGFLFLLLTVMGWLCYAEISWLEWPAGLVIPVNIFALILFLGGMLRLAKAIG